MRTFLGAPILVNQVPDGSLYLTEKAGKHDRSPHDDEDTVVALAGFAGLAIERDQRRANGGPD